MRMEKNGVRYFSFSELVTKTNEAKPIDEDKLKKFQSKHICRACKQPLSYVCGNVMACRNPECKGIKVVHKDKDGNDVASYQASFELLDEIGANIAQRYFE